MDEQFEVLGLTKDASEAEIRQRYLELVRAFSPERAPERFAAIHAAYSALRDPTARLESQLFNIECESDSLESLARDLRHRLRRVRLPVETLLLLADSP
jgi:curved DNA-binding protein CbpA